MEWKEFWPEWSQRLLDILLSVKVWILIATFTCVFTGVSISSVAATIITTVAGAREAYKVYRTHKGTGDNDKV
jgi:hypothetical protein